MTIKLGKQASTDGQISYRAKFLHSVARPTYNWSQFEGYMKNVRLNYRFTTLRIQLEVEIPPEVSKFSDN